jgi:hypothetical protein
MAGSKKIAITLLYSLIAAGCMILFVIGTYLAGPAAFISNTVYFAYAVLIALAVAAAFAQKKANDGWLGFREAVAICFTLFVVGLAVLTLTSWLLVNVIDPAFKQKVLPELDARTERTYRWFNMPEDQIRQRMEETKGDDPFTLGRMVMGLALFYIVHFFIALLIAAVVKRKKEPAGNPGT